MSSDIFFRIEHSRTADEVVQQIEGLILEGVLRAGNRLPGERELARQFDVSRPILRAALKELESRELLITRHGGGTFVADVIGQVFSEPIMRLIASHRKAIADYLEYRREIEGIAAEYAALRATGDDREMLGRIMARMEIAHENEDDQEETAVDVEFHNTIGECAHNIILLHTLRSCYRLLADGVFLNRTLIYGLPGARDRMLEQHKSIYEAVVSGKPDEAREASRAHITYIERAMQEASRTDDWQRISRLRLQQRSGLDFPARSGKTSQVGVK